MPNFSTLKLPRKRPHGVHGGCSNMMALALSFSLGIACLLLACFGGGR